MSFVAQTVIVTLVALAAVGWILWRVFGVLRPADTPPGCSTCPAHKKGCGTAAPQVAPAGSSAPMQMRLHRPDRPARIASGR